MDALVRIEGDDRAGLERLARYCARGPVALERLYAPGGIASLASPDARLVYRLPGPDPDGRTELWLTPIELLERLARLADGTGGTTAKPASTPVPEPSGTSRSARISWARLLARICEVLPLLCPACGGEMRVLSFITHPLTVQAILLHLALPHRPPPLTPAHAPPQAELEPLPEPDFDQSPPGDWDA